MKPTLAKAIINRLGGTGTPPEFGVEHFTVGLEPYLGIIEEEYLESFIKLGGSAFKLVIGNYGGGKTHFLYRMRDISWSRGYAVSYVALSPVECPFNRLELVYKATMANLMYPMRGGEEIKPYERGIDGFLRNWYMEKSEEFGEKGEELLPSYVRSIAGIESSSFANAVKEAFLSLYGGGQDYERILQWLKGEEIDRPIRHEYGITERLDKATAFRLLRSLAQWVKAIGYSGLILLFDEAERGLSMASSRERRVAMDNLRQLVDECGNSRLPGVMVFYAIPDERQLLEERLEVYEALRQRLSGLLTGVNPSGLRINLEELGMEPVDFLSELGRKLSHIYQNAYPPFAFHQDSLKQTIAHLAQVAYEERYADVGHRRVFVKGIIQAFHHLRSKPAEPIGRDQARRIIRDQLMALEMEMQEEADQMEY